MTRLLVGTDSERTSQALAEYVDDVTDANDEIYVVNSLVGGDATSSTDVRAGDEALDAFVESMGGRPVERDQFVRGNHPVEDLLEAADDWGADELVIGIRKRSPVGKMVFGSTAQNVLLEFDIPVRCVPMVSD